jgi:hypothetical protein
MGYGVGEKEVSEIEGEKPAGLGLQAKAGWRNVRSL